MVRQVGDVDRKPSRRGFLTCLHSVLKSEQDIPYCRGLEAWRAGGFPGAVLQRVSLKVGCGGKSQWHFSRKAGQRERGEGREDTPGMASDCTAGKPG